MSVKTGQTITVDFTTRRFDTGAATNADSTPTGALVVNGTDDAATVTVTNKATGKYKAAVTLPTLAVGDVVQLRIAATVNSVADNEVIWQDSVDVGFDASGKVAATVASNDLTDIQATRAAKIDNLDASVASRSTLTAADVWSHATRTLTSFGTLIADIWTNVTRTITGGSLTNSSASVVVVNPVATGGYTTVFQGDDHLVSNDRELLYSTTAADQWPDLTDATVTIYMAKTTQTESEGVATFEKELDVIEPAGANKQVQLELTSSESSSFAAGPHSYELQIRADIDDEITTLVSATMTVIEEV